MCMHKLENPYLEQLEGCFHNEYMYSTKSYNISILGIGSELLDSLPEDILDVVEGGKEVDLDLSGEDVSIWLDGETLCIEGECVRIKIKGVSEIKAKLDRLHGYSSKAIV